MAPIQLAIRLLVTEGSRLLELPDMRARRSRAFDPRSLTYPWAHADPRVDALQSELDALVGVNLSAPRARASSLACGTLAHDAAGVLAPRRTPSRIPARAAIPYLNEPWYC